METEIVSGMTGDGMAEASEALPGGQGPDVGLLLEEYQLAWSQDPMAANRIALAEDIRYSRWPGQSSDGLKHQELMPEGKRALPYDRAPDTRVMLADDIIEGLVAFDYLAFWNSRVKTAPAAANSLSVAQGAEWRQLISWLIHGPLKERLTDDVELASQMEHTLGWVVLHPCWYVKSNMVMRTVTVAGIVQLAAQAPEGSLAQKLPELIADPTLEEAAVELLRGLFGHLKEGRARQVLKELRETGEAEFPVPGRPQHRPEIAVLIPWVDFVMPAEGSMDPENARWLARRKFFTEADLRGTAAEEEWDAEFVEAAVKTMGQKMEHGPSEAAMVDANMKLIEIVYMFSRGVDDDGIRAMYCTVISPHVGKAEGGGGGGGRGGGGLYGAHWLMDDAHGHYPFIICQREVTGRRPNDSRGVPDIVMTAQQEMKQQRDATYVYSQMSVTPPLQKRGTQASKLPPELGPMGILHNASGQDWTWFPPPAGKPEIAFTLQEQVRNEKNDRFGLPRPGGDPTLVMALQQKRATRLCTKWSSAFWMLSALAYEHMGPEELYEILGHAPLLDAETVARHRLALWYDARTQSPDWVESLIKNVLQVITADTGGAIDHNKLVSFVMSYLDPTLAEEVTTDMEGAKQAVFKGVRDEITSMMQGNEGMYTQNDPAAGMKMKFALGIIEANPDYGAQLNPQSPGFNQRKRELVDKYLQNLGQSVKQQQNKIVGRLGVKPGGMDGGAGGAMPGGMPGHGAY